MTHNQKYLLLAWNRVSKFWSSFKVFKTFHWRRQYKTHELSWITNTLPTFYNISLSFWLFIQFSYVGYANQYCFVRIQLNLKLRKKRKFDDPVSYVSVMYAKSWYGIPGSTHFKTTLINWKTVWVENPVIYNLKVKYLSLTQNCQLTTNKFWNQLEERRHGWEPLVRVSQRGVEEMAVENPCFTQSEYITLIIHKIVTDEFNKRKFGPGTRLRTPGSCVTAWSWVEATFDPATDRRSWRSSTTFSLIFYQGFSTWINTTSVLLL